MHLIRRLLACKVLMHLLFALYLLVMLRLTVLRPRVLLPQPELPLLNLHPAEAYIDWVQRGMGAVAVIELAGNLIWFAPFGAYVAWSFPRLPFWALALAGLGFSLAIEVSQFFLATGVADIDDLVLNTLGSALGAVAMGRFTGTEEE